MLGSGLEHRADRSLLSGRDRPGRKLRGFEHGAEAVFSHAVKRGKDGLLVPVMCVNYGGDLAVLGHLRGYANLHAACAECGVALMEAPMSLTGMVNVGEGAVIVACGRKLGNR